MRRWHQFICLLLAASALANVPHPRLFHTTNGLIAYTNRDSQVTRYVRDVAGRLTAVTNANLEVTQFAYDAKGASSLGNAG